jgi:hypothetical protein
MTEARQAPSPELEALIAKRQSEWGRRRFEFNDGGQKAAGIRGRGACVTRAIAIATRQPFAKVQAALDANSKGRKDFHQYGVNEREYHFYLVTHGWESARLTDAQGKRYRGSLRNAPLPKGRIIVKLSSHLVCVNNGVILDTFNCDLHRTTGTYWRKRK